MDEAPSRSKERARQRNDPSFRYKENKYVWIVPYILISPVIASRCLPEWGGFAGCDLAKEIRSLCHELLVAGIDARSWSNPSYNQLCAPLSSFPLCCTISTTLMSATTARSVLGPLTTTYIAPGICSNYAEIPGNGESWQAQGCANGDVVDTSSCWPPALVSAPEPPYYGWGFYSPGLVCPSGYASACAAALNTDGSAASVPQTSSFGFQFPLIPGETAVGCCPKYVGSAAYTVSAR